MIVKTVLLSTILNTHLRLCIRYIESTVDNITEAVLQICAYNYACAENS